MAVLVQRGLDVKGLRRQRRCAGGNLGTHADLPMLPHVIAPLQVLHDSNSVTKLNKAFADVEQVDAVDGRLGRPEVAKAVPH